MIAALAFLARVPRWAWYAAGAVALVIAALLYVGHREREAVRADRARAAAEALSDAREADERAHAAAAGKSEEVFDANDRARQAAAGSDDPLGDGLRSLRAEAGRDRQAAR